jgi:uncharacterized membrane protein HdeD (DUF308 family)
LGAMFVFNSEGIFEIYSIVFGLWAIFSGVIQLSTSFQIKALEFKKWWWMSAGGVINIVLGGFLAVNPFDFETILLMISGILVIVLGITTIMEFFVYR